MISKPVCLDSKVSFTHELVENVDKSKKIVVQCEQYTTHQAQYTLTEKQWRQYQNLQIPTNEEQADANGQSTS